MSRRKIVPTLIGYLRNTIRVLFTVLLGLAIAGFLGIETTSFAAFGLAADDVIAGVGVTGDRRGDRTRRHHHQHS